ncbi:unnamed protein product [Cunninghamella blakesleeana]
MTKLLDDGEPKEEVYDLVLVDIWETKKNRTIVSIKKNLYDEDLKYISISYRWGEMEEQLLETPDYTAHVTSFHLSHLENLCKHITNEPELKEIRYLWIDAISVNQQNHERKKETILKMNQIYQKASFILAVPDMHRYYLFNHPLNMEAMDLVYKYKDIIHNDIHRAVASNNDNIENPTSDSTQHPYNNYQPAVTENPMHNVKENEELRKEMEELRMEIEKLRKENENFKAEKKEDELKRAYQFLAYLVEDWSNRVWVISEYRIAREKYIKHGTPLKYIFASLLWNRNQETVSQSFFSYTFDDQHTNKDLNDATSYYCEEVDDGRKLIDFLKSKFMERSFIDMMVKSKASKNEDRFYAVLPSLSQYKYLTENKNTISSWNITEMQSVKLKLYELLDDNDDLWNKARLLYYSSNYDGKPVLPSFAAHHLPNPTISELENINHAHEWAMYYISELEDAGECDKDDYEKKHGPILKQNLNDIQFNKQQCYISISADKYFIFDKSSLPILFDQEELSKYSLVDDDDDDDDLELIYIPYFTYNMPDEDHPFPIYKNAKPVLSGILLIGNMNMNRWILYQLWGCNAYDDPSLCASDDYTFNIY